MPDMILEHTTQRVLVMEWVEGRRLRRAGKDGEGPSAAELQEDLKLVEIGVQCSLEQVWYYILLYVQGAPGTLALLLLCMRLAHKRTQWMIGAMCLVQILEVGFHHAGGSADLTCSGFTPSSHNDVQELQISSAYVALASLTRLQ